MIQSMGMKITFAVISAAVIFCEGALDLWSYVFASEKQPKGGTHMSTFKTDGTASGSISLNGEKIVLNHAYALAQPNTFDEKKFDIAVLLTENPVPESELKDIEQLENVAYKKHNYAFFKINDQGEPIYEVIEHPLLNNTRLMMSGLTSAKFVSGVFNKELIEGVFKTDRAEDFGGYKYEINVEFSAHIQQAKLPEPLPDAKTGKPLPSDGGDPAKAYFSYRKAIETNDIASFRKLFQPPAGVELTDNDIKEGIEFMKASAPKDLKITEGYINSAGDRAVVYLTGTEDKERVYGAIEMIKADNVWMVAKENWSNIPPKQ